MLHYGQDHSNSFLRLILGGWGGALSINKGVVMGVVVGVATVFALIRRTDFLRQNILEALKIGEGAPEKQVFNCGLRQSYCKTLCCPKHAETDNADKGCGNA